MRLIKELLHIAIGLAITLAGLGACVAFGMFAFMGVPILALGLGVLGAAIESVTPPGTSHAKVR